MYHCHIALHEDEGMMGQFIVSDLSSIKNPLNNQDIFTVFPNPANDKLYVKFNDSNYSAYYVKIIDALGRTMLMLPKPELQNGIDVSHLPKGIYSIILTENKSKLVTTKTFVIE